MINQMVLSREIEWIGYESKKRMLQVEFIVGGVYQYHGVPENVYEDFLKADSYCGFFETYIKGKYPYRKVR
ncbi:MAG: KTSC domain-containing protein [Candidatus Omnitrophica bacterium]|nr:KTSC domain-containing protein [Candidatus Omnitrophota bacterium]